MSDRKPLLKLESSELWQQSQKVAKQLTTIAAELPEEERISVGYRLRSNAFSLTSDIAEALGATIYRDSEYPLSMARKDVFSLKNAYRFLGVQGVLKIDPHLMLQLDDIVTKLDHEVNTAWDTNWTITKLESLNHEN